MEKSTLIYVILTIFLFLLGVLICCFPKYRAIKEGKSEVSYFSGLMKLILWGPSEGIVILRNKKIRFISQKGNGGSKFIYPIWGDEVFERVPMSIQYLTWEDDNVLTRESIQVYMKVAVWWRISSIRAYVFEIGRLISEGEEHLLRKPIECAETWLKSMTEGTLRRLVAQSSIGQIISSTPASYLHVENGNGQNGTNEIDFHLIHDRHRDLTIAENLGAKLQNDLNNKITAYGIQINRIEIQEIRFSPIIQDAINEVWLAALKPAKSEYETKAICNRLKGAAEVLGVDAIAMERILKALRGMNFMMTPYFISDLFSMITREKTKYRPKNISGRDPQFIDGNGSTPHETHTIGRDKEPHKR
ncbi:hypothetical protein JW964_24440 [candidate division KSB1 bacterium]|nr:hypothetical protein [candidate division KSB1 bacterium]